MKIKKPIHLWAVVNPKGHEIENTGYYKTRERARQEAHNLAVVKNLSYTDRPLVQKKVLYQEI